jgi:hypothetical protein
MLSEIYKRAIKRVIGNGGTNITIPITPEKRLHALQVGVYYAAGTNTVAGVMTALTKIEVLTGTLTRWKLSGTQLRDWLLLHGTVNDFDGVPNTAGSFQMTIPFAPDWFIDPVADMLAWNPSRLSGPITVELTFSAAATITANEFVSDDLNAPSLGIITLEEIKPVAAGTEFIIGEQIKPIGRLISASIYPDTINSRAITPVTLYLGGDNFPAHEEQTDLQNDEELGRKGLTPAATGRTANIYDIVPVKSDMLLRGWDLAAWGSAKLKIGAAAAMDGTCSIIIARLEPK